MGACSVAASAEDTVVDQEEAVSVSTSEDTIGWGDDNTHLEVVTVNAPGASTPSSDQSGGSTDQEPSDEPAGESVTLITPSGTQVLDGPPPGLIPVEPANADEVAALEIAEPGSYIAVDVDGEIGAPGTRYVRSLTTLTALEPGNVSGNTGNDSTDEGGEIFADLDVEADAIEVQVETGSTDEEIVERIAAMDGVVEVELVGPGIITVSVDQVNDEPVASAIGRLDGVEAVNEDVLAHFSDDTRQAEQWAIENLGDSSQAAGWPGVVGADINAIEAWNVTTGAGVTVAVIDSGQDLAHRDLAANTWTNSDESCGNGVDDDANGFVDDCQGWDFGNHDNSPSNPPSSNGAHGSHVAGIIAAARNGVGVVGATPDATLMPLKVARDDGAIPMSAVAAAINYASDNGAKVINLSLGTAPGSSLGTNSSTELAIRHARELGVVVVVAAGNDGANLDVTGPGWPAGFAGIYDNVITVGASTNSDTHAYFSNTGRIVGLHAPGWAILSTVPGSTEDFKWGTSMAAPYVAAGAAAVIASGRATEPADVIARLKATAADLGWGSRLDLAAAVGYEAPLEGADLTVTVGGADQLLADVPGTLEWNIEAAESSTATGVRLSVAALHGGTIGAVEGLEVSFSDDAGELATATSDASGAFPVLPIRDAQGLVSVGARLSATLTLPATEYAFVVELVDDLDAEVSAPYAAYVSVDGPDDPPTTTTPGTTSPTTTIPNSGGSTPTTTTPGTTSPTTTTPGSSTPGTTVPNDPPPPPPPDSGTPSPTTIPGGGGTTTPTTTSPGDPGSGSSPTTTAPGGGSAPSVTTTTAPPTTPPASGTTAPGGDQPTTTTPDSNTTTTTTSPTSDPSTPTTTTPDPARDGAYRALSISPNSGPIDGFTRVNIAGSFPSGVPVYVWFGDQPTAAVRATMTADGLTVDTPTVDETGVRDVIIKFVTTRAHELRLVDAFTYTESTTAPSTTAPSTTAPGTPTTTPGSTVTTAPSSPGVTTTTTPANSPNPPGTSPTTSTTTSTTTPGSPTPTTAPPSGGDGGSSQPPDQRELGNLTLRSQPTSGALSRLTLASWPTPGCTSDTCPTTRL